MNAEIEIEGTRLMLADEMPHIGSKSPASLAGTSVVLDLHVADSDLVFRLVSEEALADAAFDECLAAFCVGRQNTGFVVDEAAGAPSFRLRRVGARVPVIPAQTRMNRPSEFGKLWDADRRSGA